MICLDKEDRGFLHRVYPCHDIHELREVAGSYRLMPILGVEGLGRLAPREGGRRHGTQHRNHEEKGCAPPIDGPQRRSPTKEAAALDGLTGLLLLYKYSSFKYFF